MLVKHELTVYGTCPVNGARDTYHVIVEANRILQVEAILNAVDALPEKAFQEELTQILASQLEAKITTIGFHSGVKTTCIA